MAKKTSIKVRLVPENKPDSAFFYYAKKPSSAAGKLEKCIVINWELSLG